MEQSKKRKRAEGDGGSNASAQRSYASVKVKHIPPEDTALGPIIAATPGLSAPEDITFTPYRRTTQSRTTGEKRRQILLQSSQHGRLDYIAQEEAAGGPHGNLRHYVAIFDPEAGEVTVTECHKVTLRASLRPSQEEIDEMKNQEKESYASMRMTLGQEFGTKKAKKVIADQTVNAINQRGKGETAPPVDAAQQAMLDALNIKTESMPTKEEQQAQIDQAKPRPNPNLAAASPADVYPISNLVSEDDLSLMKVNDWQASSKKHENVNLTMRYVARRLQKVATVKDDTNLKLLKYVNIMLTWFAALSKTRDGRKVPNRDKLKEQVDAPGAIFESFRRQFTDGFIMTKWFMDKFILYMCAIALHIDNFEVDTNDLMEDLQLDPLAMTKFYTELGCRVTGLTAAQRDQMRISPKEVGTHKIARLLLPLEFPQMRQRRGPPRR